MLYMISVIIFVILFLLFSAIKILNEYERGVILRLGRFVGVRGPGLIILIPVIEKLVKVSLRTFVLDVPPQDVITKDNVSVSVNAVIYFRVIHAEKAILEVASFRGQTDMGYFLRTNQLSPFISLETFF